MYFSERGLEAVACDDNSFLYLVKDLFLDEEDAIEERHSVSGSGETKGTNYTGYISNIYKRDMETVCNSKLIAYAVFFNKTLTGMKFGLSEEKCLFLTTEGEGGKEETLGISSVVCEHKETYESPSIYAVVQTPKGKYKGIMVHKSQTPKDKTSAQLYAVLKGDYGITSNQGFNISDNTKSNKVIMFRETKDIWTAVYQIKRAYETSPKNLLSVKCSKGLVPRIRRAMEKETPVNGDVIWTGVFDIPEKKDALTSHRFIFSIAEKDNNFSYYEVSHRTKGKHKKIQTNTFMKVYKGMRVMDKQTENLTDSPENKVLLALGVRLVAESNDMPENLKDILKTKLVVEEL